jgi:hypothetical protein
MPTFASRLSVEGRRRRDRRIPRVGLHHYSASAFKHLLDSGDDQSLLNACGHDHASFWCLNKLFKPIYDSHLINVSTGFIVLKTTTAMVLLYSYQTAQVGIDQIQNTYMPEISADAN